MFTNRPAISNNTVAQKDLVEQESKELRDDFKFIRDGERNILLFVGNI